jgi:hypothetical protein
MDDKLTPAARIAAYLFVPAALVLLLPFVLLFVIGYYLFVLVQSVRSIIDALLGRKTEPEQAMQKPHFLDRPRDSASASDESNQAAN